MIEYFNLCVCVHIYTVQKDRGRGDGEEGGHREKDSFYSHQMLFRIRMAFISVICTLKTIFSCAIFYISTVSGII